MKWAELKHKIAANFCRTVLVLDDEILIPSTQDPTSLESDKKFLKAKEQFAKLGILCDLRQIDETVAADSAPMMSSLRHADVVVVDWYLGRNSNQNPAESVAVLDAILTFGGERFVAIHSQESADKIRRFLSQRYSLTKDDVLFEGGVEEANVEPVAEDTIIPEVHRVNESGPDIFILSSKTPSGPETSRVHLCVLHKRDPLETAESLPGVILKALEKAFPDHVHWIGLEFAARVRDMLPAIVRSLPSQMDIALVFQALVQGSNHLADDIVECLCLEVSEKLRVERIEAATDKVILGRFTDGIQPLSRVPNIPGTWLSEIKSCESPGKAKEWARTTKLLSKANRDPSSSLIKHALSATSHNPGTAHSRYAALREHLHVFTSANTVLYPGVVLVSRSTADASAARWKLCLTPSCDCDHEGDHHHLFIDGYEESQGNKTNGGGVWTSIYTGQHEVQVKWMVAAFQTLNCTRKGPEGWDPVTRLRDPFVHLIVQKLWGQQSRVGVNTSEYQRSLRKDSE